MDRFGGLTIVFLLAFSSICAANPFTLTSKQRLHVIDYYGSSALLRLEDFTENMAQWQKLSKEKQLLHVNHYVNTISGEFDVYTQGTQEYWATPKEFLFQGRGDCEDYVTLKYYALQQLGFSKEKLFYAVVKERYGGAYHMVLLYEAAPATAPLVLDNLSHMILPLHERSDLQLVDFFNSSGRYRYDEGFHKIRLKANYKEFSQLQQRMLSGK